MRLHREFMHELVDLFQRELGSIDVRGWHGVHELRQAPGVVLTQGFGHVIGQPVDEIKTQPVYKW